VQHAGGGKADQWFIRGFDADHGTDIAVFVDGVPVNLTSHGHGQGYADSHWLIPETVGSIEVHKGPYAARFGDFYTAGAVETATIDRAPNGGMVSATVGVGLDGPERLARPSHRVVGMVSPELASGSALLAAEVGVTDGPFLNRQDFRRGSLLGKWTHPIGDGALTILTTAYAARWNQSGQIPAAEVEAGRLDRFGAIDPTEGGTTSRASVAASYEVTDAKDAIWHLGAYLIGYRLRLFSDFTLFARDPVHGDQIEQTDRRSVYGVDAYTVRPHHLGAIPGRLRLGVQARADNIQTELWHAAQRVRLADCFDTPNPCNATSQLVRDFGLYAEEDLAPLRRLDLKAGVRLDQYTWDVDDLDPDTRTTPATTGGTAQRAILNPKLSAIIHATDDVDVFANAGGGYHSNDARAAVATHGTGALARALGAEVGVRVRPTTRLRGSADVWYLHLASEQVWSGDAGGTEAAGPTRRFGLDVEASAELTDWLSIDGNIALARATLVANAGNGGALALAPRLMGSGGVLGHWGPSFVSLRVRGIGARPANDDGSLTAQGFVLFDAVAGTRWHKIELGITAENLLDAKWREAQFAEDSRVSPTAPIVEDVHFTPGAPLTVLGTIAVPI
jgi:outer membrane receptor protein involved in Fe transport